MNRYSLDYALFIEKQVLHQKEMERYIEECVCLENGAISSLSIINENVLDTIKEFIDKIIESIKKVFGRVTESLTKSFKNDKDYLTKYSKIILQKKPTITLNDYFDYKLDKLINNGAIPKFAYEEMHSKGALESKSAFVGQYFKEYPQPSGDQNFGTLVENEIKGQAIATKEGADLNMKTIYNFVFDYDKLVNGLNTDIDTLNKSKLTVIDTISNLQKEQNSASANSNPEDDKTKDTKNQESDQNESVIYSNVYGGFITEASIIQELTTAKSGNSSSSNNNSNGSTSIGANKPEGTESAANSNRNTTGHDDKDLKKSFGGKDLDNVKKESEIYFDICGQFLSAKLRLVNDIYKDYMFIIREHVRSIVGTDGSKSADKAIDSPLLYKASDDNMNKLNESERNEYNTLRQDFDAVLKQYYAVGKNTGALYYRDNPNAQWVKITENDNATDILNNKVLKALEDRDEWKAYKDFCEKHFTDFKMITPQVNDTIRDKEDKK